MNSPFSSRLSRRRFLWRTGAAAALFQIAPAHIFGANPPSERLNLAGIGVGSQGGSDVDSVAAEGQNIVALCDVDFKYAGKEAAKYPKARQFKDFRVMLDQMGKEIDGVIIGTPDHTHAVIAMEAIRRGKHVYCEKPLTHTVDEARALIKASAKSKVVTQLGNQGHSSGSIRQVCEWVWAGAIGKVHTVQTQCDAFKEVYCQMRNLDKLNQHYDTPAELDYDLWLGPVPPRPYTPFWVHWNWRGWLPFGTGTVGDWFCHVVDPAYWALDLGAPTAITAEVQGWEPAKHGLTYPPAAKITFEFPAKGTRGPVNLVWNDGNQGLKAPDSFPKDEKLPGIGALLIGDKGIIMHGSHGGGGCRLLPDSLADQYGGKNAPAEKIKRVKGHHWDWIDAIRTGRKAGSDFSYGGPLTQVALLGAIAIRYPGQTLHWDDHAGRFTNMKEANAWLNPHFRKGWKI